MTANTPFYGWPYQTIADAPNGPNLGSGLALGIETTVHAIDTRLAAAEATAAKVEGATIDWASSLVLGAATTPPTKGNSVYTAEYKDIDGWVDYEFSINIGTTFSPGSGNYRFPVPIAARANCMAVGKVLVLDTGSAYRVGSAVFQSTTAYLTILLEALGGFALSNTGPAAGGWAPGDLLQCSIRYRH